MRHTIYMRMICVIVTVLFVLPSRAEDVEWTHLNVNIFDYRSEFLNRSFTKVRADGTGPAKMMRIDDSFEKMWRFDGDSVAFRYPVASMPAVTSIYWEEVVTGTVGKDTVISIKAGYPLFPLVQDRVGGVWPEDAGSWPECGLYPACLETAADGSQKIVIDRSRESIRFKWSRDGSIVLLDCDDATRGYTAFFESTGEPFLPYMDSEVRMYRGAAPRPSMPEDVEPVKCQLTYGDRVNYPECIHVDVGVRGDSIYVSGKLRNWELKEDFYDMPFCIKGSIRNGKAFFQYGQPADPYDDYTVQLVTMDLSRQGGWDLSEKSWYPSFEDLEFDFDSDAMCLSNANHSFTVCPFGYFAMGNEINSDHDYNPYMYPYVPAVEKNNIDIRPALCGKPTVPTAPAIVKICSDDSSDGNSSDGNSVDTGGYYRVYYSMSNRDARGRVMKNNELYFRVRVNGEDYTFDKDKYTHLESDMRDVPFYFIDEYEYDVVDHIIGYGFDFCNDRRRYDIGEFIIHEEDVMTVGMQSVYYGGGEEHASEWVYSNTSGVEAVEDDAACDGILYDLHGRKVSSDTPAPGIYIRDGKKIVIR